MADDDEDEDGQEIQSLQPAGNGGSASEWDAFPLTQQPPSAPQPAAPRAAGSEWDAFPLAQQPQQQRPVSDKGWDAFPLADKQPEAESGPAAFIRELAHGVGPAAAAAAGGMLTAGAAGSVFGPVGTAVAGLGGGAIAGYGAATVQEGGLNLLGQDDAILRAANAREHPWWSAAGTGISNLAGFGAGLTRGAIGLGGRLLSGAISGGGEAGVQAYRGSSLEEAIPPVVAQTAAGMAFPQPYKWGEAAQEAGARWGTRGRQYFRPETPAPHGSPGAEAAAGTAEAKPAPTEAGGAPQPTNTNNYAKAEPRPASTEEAAGGVNVGSDPTIEAALRAKMQPEGEAEPSTPARTIAAEQQPGEVLRGPEPAAAAPEPPTAFGQKLDAEFPRNPDAAAQARPLVEERAPPPPPAQAPAPPKFSIAKDAETGRHVLFRDDEAIGDFANRGEAMKARNLALIKDTAARRQQAAPLAPEGTPTPRDNAAFRAKQEAVPDEPEGTPRPLGAAAAPPPGAPPGAPPAPSLMGRLSNSLRTAASKLADIGSDIQMKVAPLARGTKESMVAAKDWADAKRRISYEWGERDRQITEQFTPEQRKRVWDAMDEESVMRQRGEKSEHMGIATLTPEEHALAETTQEWARDTWGRMRDVGMVEGEGLPYWTPRKLINAATSAAEEGGRSINRIGSNLSTTAPSLKRRKYLEAEQTEEAARARFGEQAEIARDIRALPLALAEMEHAIAGRQMMNAIREAGKRTGQETVAVGAKPTDSEHTWFTVDHPAFYTWRPKLEEADTAAYRTAVEQTGGIKVPPAKIPLMDRNGEPVFEKVPLYVRGDFEGPLRATLSEPSGLAYKTAMDLKGKTMGLIMNSPLIHNAVEWGRALPAMPGKVATFKIYFEGNAAKQPPPGKIGASPTMLEAVNAGMVPIGKRFFNQDIHAIMEEPNLTPGRSWTAKVLGAVPGLFDKAAAGDAVKRSIDRAGDFWHNTLLWDRVGDLQAGLYVNRRDALIAQGLDPKTAQRMAAHEANRYAGAIPQEAMSNAARKFANLLLFSRSFTLGNLGVMKDMVNGMPRAVRAQIERDVGSVDPKADGYIKSLAQRKAISIVMLDMGLMYAGNSLLQSGLNVMRGDKTLDDEARGYADRLYGMMQNVGEHPMSLLQPLKLAEKLSSTSENEPGKQDRILIGHSKDGTAIYARNPVGKIGEEFAGWASGPLDMLRKKLGTIARPAWQILSNDKGFGRKVYDPNADTPAKYMKNMGLIVEQLFGAQTPEGQIRAASDLATGQGDPKVAAAQALGPIAGVTFSKGAPGGPAAGELYKAREEHQFQVNEALPDIRRMIQNGDEQGARQRMRELGIAPGLQNFYVRTTKNPQLRLSPRAVRDFNQYAPPEVRARFQRDLERQRQQQQPEG